jgi:beta-glucosidase
MPFFEHKGRRVGISDKAYRNAWERACKLMEQMTLEEKISQLGSSSRAIERLKLPSYNFYTGEALHGLTRDAPATQFPMPLALAATWNPDLILQIYTASPMKPALMTID